MAASSTKGKKVKPIQALPLGSVVGAPESAQIRAREPKNLSPFTDPDKCAKCGDSRKAHKNKDSFSYFHASGYSSGGGRDMPILAVTSADMSSCVAFIEPGETFTLLDKRLPPKSLVYFNAQWLELHGPNTKLRKPWFAR